MHLHLKNTPALSLSNSNRLRHASHTSTIFVEASTLHCKTNLLFTTRPFHFSLQDRSTLHCRTVPVFTTRPFHSSLRDRSALRIRTSSHQDVLVGHYQLPSWLRYVHLFRSLSRLYSSRSTNSDRIYRPEVPAIQE